VMSACADNPASIVTSECWLKGMTVINVAQSIESLPCFRRGERKATVKALRQEAGMEAYQQLESDARHAAISLTEFVQPKTFTLCKGLAQARDDLKSRLIGESVFYVHDWYQFPLLRLMLNTLRGGAIRARPSGGDEQSLFESVTHCSCDKCAQLLEQCVLLRALRCTELRRGRIEWKKLLGSLFRAGYVIPYAALLVFTSSTSAALETTSTDPW
jgi:hypothetical protein